MKTGDIYSGQLPSMVLCRDAYRNGVIFVGMFDF